MKIELRPMDEIPPKAWSIAIKDYYEVAGSEIFLGVKTNGDCELVEYSHTSRSWYTVDDEKKVDPSDYLGYYPVICSVNKK